MLSLLLAAGGSTRMGRPKATLDWGGRSLLAAWCERLGALGQVVVVQGAVALEGEVPPGVLLVNNPDWRTTGPWESLVLGAGEREGPALVTPVDVPPCSAEALQRLVEAGPPAILGWAGRPGHPVLVEASRLRGPCPEGGLAALLREAVLVEGDGPATLANMNRAEDYERFSP